MFLHFLQNGNRNTVLFEKNINEMEMKQPDPLISTYLVYKGDDAQEESTGRGG